MTKMAAMPIYGKNPSNIFFSGTGKLISKKLGIKHWWLNAPVICIPGSPGAGDIGHIAGLKCLALTSDVSRQCRGFAGVMISRQYTVKLIQIRF